MKAIIAVLSCVLAVSLVGCTPDVDFASIQKPSPPEQLGNLKAFVGAWTWEAERVVDDGPDEAWKGTAEWKWVLGGTYLFGKMTSTGPNQSFNSSGYWGWHPKKKTYVWWMLNDWGYPQEGTAKYDASDKRWTMSYEGVGLDGTTSHGRYTMTVVDDRTLEWSMTEWADALHTIKKIEMNGRYLRK
jgi:Protein of unknown function (DUF1579)